MYVTKCIFFNENPVNHKICQIAIWQPEILVKFETLLSVGGARREGRGTFIAKLRM